MEYKYCMRITSWGIVVFLNAEIAEYVEDISDETIKQVAEKIWITYQEKNVYYDAQGKCLSPDLPYLEKGLQLVQKQIQAHSKYEETLIIIQSMWFNYCDFQEEGLTAAIMEWAAQAFGFECPEIPVEYDKENRRYVYDFDAIRFASEQHD